MADPDKVIDPPVTVPPIAGDQHSQAWTEHNQAVADRINELLADVATLQSQVGSASNGVTDGSDAAAGKIGEYMTTTGGAVALSTGVATGVASVSLTAGDWQVSGVVFFTPSGTAHATRCAAGVDTGTAITGSDISTTFATGVGTELTAGPRRFNVTATTTVNVVAVSAFTGGTMTAQGTVNARRVR